MSAALWAAAGVLRCLVVAQDVKIQAAPSDSFALSLTIIEGLLAITIGRGYSQPIGLIVLTMSMYIEVLGGTGCWVVVTVLLILGFLPPGKSGLQEVLAPTRTHSSGVWMPQKMTVISAVVLEKDPVRDVYVPDPAGSQDMLRYLFRSWVATTVVAVVSVLLLGLWAGPSSTIVGLAFIFAWRYSPCIAETINPSGPEQDLGIPDGHVDIFEGTGSRRGAGYVCRGVLHTAYHVTQGNVIQIGDQEFYPYSGNRRSDWITYGGRHRGTSLERDDVVSVEYLEGNRLITSRTVANISKSGSVTLSLLASRHGYSGSPVFKIIEDGLGREAKEFASNFGTYVTFNDQYYGIVPYPSLEDLSYTIRRGHYEQVCAPCGAGKTRSACVQIIRAAKLVGKTVYYSPPTKLLCESAVGVFQSSGLTVARRYGGHSEFHAADVVVVAHASLLHMLTNQSGGRNPTMEDVYVMDEVHARQPESQVLVQLLRQHQPYSFFEISATIFIRGTDEAYSAPRTSDSFAIEDKVYNSFSELLDSGMESMTPLKRVLIICPKITPYGGCEKLSVEEVEAEVRERLEALDINVPFYRLTSATQRLVMNDIDADSGYIIISTTVAEAGVNFVLDEVWDTGVSLTPVVTQSGGGYHIRDAYTPSSTFSREQRRGRVGRFKDGVYRSTSSGQATRNLYELHDADLWNIAVMCHTLELDFPTWLPDPKGMGYPRAVLSKRRLHAWLSGNIANPYYAQYAYTESGALALDRDVRLGLQAPDGKARFRGIRMHVKDDRDRGFLSRLYALPEDQ